MTWEKWIWFDGLDETFYYHLSQMLMIANLTPQKSRLGRVTDTSEAPNAPWLTRRDLAEIRHRGWEPNSNDADQTNLAATEESNNEDCQAMNNRR